MAPIYKYGHRLRKGIERRLLESPAKSFWKNVETVSAEKAHDLIGSNIRSARPFCVGRGGGVELRIILWGNRIPQIARLGIRLPVWFSDTSDGATNAGIRPRSKESYRAFARLAYQSLEELDMLAKWGTPLEYAVLQAIVQRPVFCDVGHLAPTMLQEPHWCESLRDKKVLVVSPFKQSIDNQITHMGEIWRNRGWNWTANFQVQKFPYLIDDDYPKTWQEVWEDMLAVVNRGNYDVALFGCGGLGLPLAAAAKRAGRVGIHLGGHLQLLFGIYGQRHLEQEWHAAWINNVWIRPAREEVAKTAQRVENGCYW